MEIKPGKYYKLKNGLKALITYVHDTGLFKVECKYQGYSFMEDEDIEAQAETWYEGGMYFSRGTSPWDILEEWVEEKIVYLVTITAPSQPTYFSSISFTSKEKAERWINERNSEIYQHKLTEVKV